MSSPRLAATVASFALAAVLLPLTACKGSSAPAAPTTFVILLDKSASINEGKANTYTRYLRESVFPSLTPGSRIVIEPIVGANTYSDPEARVTATLPMVHPLTKDAGYFLLKGDLSADKTCLARVSTELGAFNSARDQFAADALRVFRGKSFSNDTYLVDGMKEASELLEPRKGRGVLVVLSDGLEDSDAFGPHSRFEDPGFWSRNQPEHLVQQVNPVSATPGLKGSNVYFYGMAAGTGHVYDNVRRFWQDFFRAANVDSISAGHQPLYEEPAYNPQPEDLCK